MNDATGPVGGEPWLAPDVDPGGPAPRAGDARPYDFLDNGRGPRPELFQGDEPPPVFPHQPWPEEDEAERSERLEAAHAELARDIEGWSPELAADIAAWGQARGFTPEELAAVDDPREVKVLHMAMIGERALAEQAHARRFGDFRPPIQVGGHGHAGHLPNDKHSVEAWMQARHSQLRKKARR